MQRQTIPINITTENNPIKMFVVVLSLAILFLLFIMVSLIKLVHSTITLPINLFLQTHFYSLNIDLVYTICHTHMRKYLDSTYTLYFKPLYLQNLHYNRLYKYHYSKFVYYCILMNLIGLRIYNFRATIHYEFHLNSSKYSKLSYLLS